MRGDLLLLALSLFLAYVQISNGCSCMPSHPQTQYCKSDFVILARVKRERIFKNNQKMYKVRIRKSYKLSEKAAVALKSGQLLTAADEAMCGVHLQIGKLYAISGSIHSLRAHIVLCDFISEWRKLTRRQRKGLKVLYKHGCNCSIKRTKTPDSCVAKSQCHVLEGICLRQNNKKCSWTKNRELANCLKTPPLTISRWSG